jgi:3-dehydroquinate synthetase
MRLDKKVAGGKIRLVLPTSVGKVTLPIVVDEKIIMESLIYLRAVLRSKSLAV